MQAPPEPASWEDRADGSGLGAASSAPKVQPQRGWGSGLGREGPGREMPPSRLQPLGTDRVCHNPRAHPAPRGKGHTRVSVHRAEAEPRPALQ